MSGTATTPAARGERRLDLRINDADYKRLQRAARDHFRSVPAEARFLIVRGLKGEQDDGAKGGR